MFSRPFACLFLSIVASAFVACTPSDPSASPGDSDNPKASERSSTISSSECSDRCNKKATKCGAPSSQAEQVCDQLCGGSLTEAEMSCLEDATCGKLETAVERGESLAEVIDLACVEERSETPSGPDKPNKPGNDELPISLTVTGSFGSTKALHTLDDDKKVLISLITLGSKPSFSPSQPRELPNISSKSIKATVNSPSLGNCKASINYTLNSGQIGVVISGKDDISKAESDCANFTDDVAKSGFEATLEDVPYPNGSTKATVTINLKP